MTLEFTPAPVDIPDAVLEYRPQEIIISTYPEVRSGWLRRDLIERVADVALIRSPGRCA